MAINPAKGRIIFAYTSLLEEKDQNKISITDLVQRANTSRTTFYNHFTGLDDLKQKSLNIAINDINNILTKNLLFKIPVLIEMLDYIKEKGFYFQVWKKYHSDFDATVTTFMEKTIKNSDIVDLEKQLEDGYHIPEKFAFDVYVLTVKTIIYKWIDSNFIESSQEIAEIIHKAVQI